MKKFLGIAMTLAAATAPIQAARSEAFGFTLTTNIPVICVLSHTGAPGADTGSEVSLGSLREFCNAPGGYDLVVSYQPGALRGARVIAGSSQIVLDGSGETVVSHSPIPHAREIPLAMAPGSTGFDTDRLDFRLIPAS